MPTDLDELLSAIDPRRMQSVERAGAEALTSYTPGPLTTNDALAFRRECCGFMQHVDQCTGRQVAGVELPDGVVWQQRVVPLLRKILGPRGELAAFELVRSGKERGGAFGLLRRLVDQAVRDHMEWVVASRVDGFCGRLTAEELMATGSEFLAKHGHLLPAEMTAGFAGRLRLNLPAVLREYHRLLKRIHDRA